jgi:hypothetical protein
MQAARRIFGVFIYVDRLLALDIDQPAVQAGAAELDQLASLLGLVSFHV